MAGFASGSSGSGRIELEVDMHAVRLALRRLDPEVEKGLRKVVKSNTTRARGMVRQSAPQRTGLLRASVRSRTQFTKDKSRGVVYVIGPARRYAWIVEHGSKAAHNAFPGFGYIARTSKEIVPRFEREMNQAIDDAIRAVGLQD